MEPAYATFEQSVALKEKGFNAPTRGYYSGLNFYLGEYKNHSETTIGDTKMHKRLIGYVSAPEQWQVIKWFEKANLYINITTEFYKDGVNFIWQVLEYDVTVNRCIGKKSSMSYGDNGEYKTREAAYSAAIDYVLNNLI